MNPNDAEYFRTDSGYPESAGINLSNPNVEISDIICGVHEYPQLGTGGVVNSFENTTGIVEINYVTLTRNIEGNVTFFVEDYNNQKELKDGESASIFNDEPETPEQQGRVNLNTSGLTFTADQVAEDGSMDITVTLQQIIEGVPHTRSLTKNIINPVIPAVISPGTPQGSSEDVEEEQPTQDQSTSTDRNGATAASTVTEGASVFIPTEGKGSIGEMREILNDLIQSGIPTANQDANRALSTGTRNGPFRPGIQNLHNAIKNSRQHNAGFKARVKASYDASVDFEKAIEGLDPLVEAVQDNINVWLMEIGTASNNRETVPVEPYLDLTLSAVISLTTEVEDVNLLGSNAQALGSEAGGDRRWQVTQLTEDAAIEFYDNVLVPVNRLSAILQVYIDIRKELAAIEAAERAAEAARLERERQAEEKRKADEAAAEEANRSRQRREDEKDEAEARAAGKAWEAAQAQEERDRQAAEREQNEEDRQRRIAELNQRRDEIRRTQRDDLIPSLSDQDLAKRLDDTRLRLAGVESGSIPDPLGLLARWLPEDITAYEQELERRSKEEEQREAALIANIRRLREQQVQERDEAIPTMSNDELLEALNSSRTYLNGINAGLINDRFDLTAIYVQENIDAYEAEIAKRQSDVVSEGGGVVSEDPPSTDCCGPYVEWFYDPEGNPGEQSWIDKLDPALGIFSIEDLVSQAGQEEGLGPSDWGEWSNIVVKYGDLCYTIKSPAMARRLGRDPYKSAPPNASLDTQKDGIPYDWQSIARRMRQPPQTIWNGFDEARDLTNDDNPWQLCNGHGKCCEPQGSKPGDSSIDTPNEGIVSEQPATTPPPGVTGVTTPPPGGSSTRSRYCELPKVWDELSQRCVCPEGFEEDENGNCVPLPEDPTTEDPPSDDSSGSSGGSPGIDFDSGLIRTGPDPLTNLDFTYTEETTTTTIPPYYTTTTTTTSTTTSTTPYYTTPPPPCTQTTRRPPTYTSTRTIGGTEPPPTPRPPRPTQQPGTQPPRVPVVRIYPAPILPLQVPFLMREVIGVTTTSAVTTTLAPVIRTIPPTTTLCPEDPDCNNLRF